MKRMQQISWGFVFKSWRFVIWYILGVYYCGKRCSLPKLSKLLILDIAGILRNCLITEIFISSLFLWSESKLESNGIHCENIVNLYPCRNIYMHKTQLSVKIVTPLIMIQYIITPFPWSHRIYSAAWLLVNRRKFLCVKIPELQSFLNELSTNMFSLFPNVWYSVKAQPRLVAL